MPAIKHSAMPPLDSSPRKGYKKTEIGVIPEDWEVKKLGSLLVRSPRYGINAAAVTYADNLPTYLRITDISENGKLRKTGRVSVSHPLSDSYLLHTEDIVVARTGASVGKSYHHEKPSEKLVFAGFLICISPNQEILNSKFASFWLNTEFYWKWIEENSMRSGQPGVNGKQLNALQIPLPPKKAEQEAIAGALSDADAWIASLEQLIAKKRRIKEGSMQALLTAPPSQMENGKWRMENGKAAEPPPASQFARRLPGFSGEWEVRTLGEVGFFLKGNGVKKDEAQSGSLPCIRYGEIYTRHRDYIKTFYSYISRQVAEGATRLKQGDILFAGSGETKAEIGKCVAFVAGGEAYAGGDIVILRPTSECPMFFGYYLNTTAIEREKASRGQGDAVVHISARALAEIPITVPPIPEQTAIATVLSEMDAEIEALEAKLAKARQIKQGMMQELLTGRTRLGDF